VSGRASVKGPGPRTGLRRDQKGILGGDSVDEKGLQGPNRADKKAVRESRAADNGRKHDLEMNPTVP
jgi:hypothetical protein